MQLGDNGDWITSASGLFIRHIEADCLLAGDLMIWLEHLYAIILLGHMLWVAILLQKEWRRSRARELVGQWQTDIEATELSRSAAAQSSIEAASVDFV